MYDDARATGQARRAGVGTGWGLPKLAWLLEESPADARGARLAHQPDLITRRLTGAAVATDESHALKSGWDAAGGGWRDDLLQALGLQPGVLPPVVRSGTLLGEVCAQAAGATGLPRGDPGRRRHDRRLRRAARRRGAARRRLELRARHDARPQGRLAAADRRRRRRPVLPSLARRRLAARRRVEQRRGRADAALPRSRARCAGPRGAGPRGLGAARLPAARPRRALPVPRARRPRVHARRAQRTTASTSPRSCRAWRTSSACAWTT